MNQQPSAGSVAMETLRLVRPDLYTAAVGTHVDPTADDKRLRAFHAWLYLVIREEHTQTA